MVKENNRLMKIRVIIKNPNSNILGVTIPSCFAEKWLNTYVSITEDNGQLILTSGTLPTSFHKNELKLHIINSEKVKL